MAERRNAVIQRVKLVHLRSAVSAVLIGLDMHLESALNDIGFVANRHPLLVRSFVPIVTDDQAKEFLGYKIKDEETAFRLVVGSMDDDITKGRSDILSAVAMEILGTMIAYDNHLPRELRLVAADTFRGRIRFQEMKSVNPGKLGRDLLFRHLAKVSSGEVGRDGIQCPITSEHEIVTGARIVHECASLHANPPSLSTLENRIGTAKHDDFIDLLGLGPPKNAEVRQPNPKWHPLSNDPANRFKPNTSIPYWCAEKEGLGEEQNCVLERLSYLKQTEIS